MLGVSHRTIGYLPTLLINLPRLLVLVVHGLVLLQRFAHGLDRTVTVIVAAMVVVRFLSRAIDRLKVAARARIARSQLRQH